MMYAVYGAAGVLCVLALLALGFALGWKGRTVWDARARRAVDRESDERERRELREQQRAFEGMLNYSADTAYGMDGGLTEDMEG